MGNSMSKPEIETLSYKPTIAELEKAIGTPNEPDIMPSGKIKVKVHTIECICNASEQPASAPRETKDKAFAVIELKTGVENKESVGQPQQCHITMTGRECEDCIIAKMGRCPLSKPEQPKDNPGPLEKLIMDRIEHDLENIAANLEMLNPETKEQKRAKCVLALEIARITGEGGIFDDLKEAFE